MWYAIDQLYIYDVSGLYHTVNVEYAVEHMPIQMDIFMHLYDKQYVMNAYLSIVAIFSRS